MTKSTNSETLHLPRILCLHGGGVNAAVFDIQCRVIINHLKTEFRLVFMDGPFLSDPHPAIVDYFGDFGPFRRWLRWDPSHPEIESQAAAEEIVYQCQRAMREDPGAGEWVGVLGFSQGAKIAASLLWTQQRVSEKLGEDAFFTNFRFGVIMAGRGPIISLDQRVEHHEHVTDAGELSSAFTNYPSTNKGNHVVTIPTLHVHGLTDPGLEEHRRLRDLYCQAGTTKLIEWDGGHRLPIKTLDVTAVVEKIRELAEETAI